MLITTSGTSRMFCKVCFVLPSLRRLTGEKIITGGFEENKLKKLNGLRLTFPALSIVDAKQTGRGATTCCKKYCFSAGLSSCRSNVIIFSFQIGYPVFLLQPDVFS